MRCLQALESRVTASRGTRLSKCLLRRAKSILWELISLLAALKATSTFCDIQEENPIRRKQSPILQIDICCRLGKIFPQNRCLGMLLAVMTVFGIFYRAQSGLSWKQTFPKISWIFPKPERWKLNGHFLPVSSKGVSLRIIDLNRLTVFSNSRDTRQHRWQPTVSIIGAFVNFNKHSDDG